MVLPKIYTNCCDFLGDGLITYTKSKIDSNYTRKIASAETFGSGFYPAIYKITVTSNTCIHINAYVANEINSMVGKIDLYVKEGNVQLVSNTNYDYSVNNNEILLSAINGPGYTKIYEIEIIYGDVVSMQYI